MGVLSLAASPSAFRSMPSVSMNSATWSSVSLPHSAQMMSCQSSTSDNAGSRSGNQFLQQRQMPRRTSFVGPLGNQDILPVGGLDRRQRVRCRPHNVGVQEGISASA